MPSLWKSGSGAGRPKSGHKSIRGTISGPIPIPSALDDEFPIRNPGTGIATTEPPPVSVDDEFPIRSPGTGIASPGSPPKEPETIPEQPTQPPPPMPTPITLVTEEVPQVSQVPPEYAGPSAGSSVPDVLETSPDAAVHVQPAEQDLQQPQPDSSSSGSPAEPGPSSATPTVAPRTPSARNSPQRNSPPRQSPPRPSPPPAQAPVQSQPQPQLRDSVVRTSTYPARQANVSSTVRYSTVSETPTGNTAQSKDGPQRKKSTLRTALGRLFGRNKKKNGHGSSQDITSSSPAARMSGPMGAAQHRSEPPAPSNREKESSPKRSASVPITEYDRPLRSHSIGPDDIIAIESARNSLQADAGTPRRRAATTSATRPFNQPFGAGLSPRPISSHTRGNSANAVPGEEDPDEIGRAITSDSGNGLRRRSRSLSGIEDIVGVRPGGARRRSDEIRYWRESYDPGFMSPPMSSGQDENEQRDDTGPLDMSQPGTPNINTNPPKTPPQPFNFGSITNEMIGMKITQAASMEQRISTLEARSYKIERVVTQLCHTVPGFRSPLPGPARAEPGSSSGTAAFSAPRTTAIPAIYETHSTSEDQQAAEVSPLSSRRDSVDSDAQSQVSFGDAPTYIGSLHPPSSSATQPQSLTATAPLEAPSAGLGLGSSSGASSLLHRPTSNSTVRGAASLPTMGRDAGGDARDAYATLMAQFEAERAARQALEAQVRKLSDRLNALSTTMYAMVGGPAKSRSQERLAPPSPLLGQQALSAKTGAAAAPRPERQPTPKALKALSVFETNDDDEVEDVGGGDDVDDTKKKLAQLRHVDDEEDDEGNVTEDFQTPREEHAPHPYGAFGEELRDEDDGDEEDPKRKKAARTLSLSQLTLGKGVHTRI